jgi:hypothetical protein
MKLKIFKWLAPALLIGGGSISSVLLTSCNNVKYEIQQIQYQGDPSNV